MKYSNVITVGLFIGALSWALSGWLTDGFEPFDSEVGFYLNQLLLSVFTIYYGFRKNALTLIYFLVAAYFGLNLYSYIFSNSEQKAWFALGLVTTLVFFIGPLILGFAANAVNVFQKRHNKFKN